MESVLQIPSNIRVCNPSLNNMELQCPIYLLVMWSRTYCETLDYHYVGNVEQDYCETLRYSCNVILGAPSVTFHALDIGGLVSLLP